MQVASNQLFLQSTMPDMHDPSRSIMRRSTGIQALAALVAAKIAIVWAAAYVSFRFVFVSRLA
jgi:hypothetical protein